MEWLPAAAVIALALTFAFTNGFQDVSNSIAIPIATGSLTCRLAVTMAALLGFGGALLGTGLAAAFSQEIITPPAGSTGLAVLGAALAASIIWNLLTWWIGMPSSSTHGLLGGLAGASLAAGTTVRWGDILGDVALPLLLSPLLGLVLAYLGLRLLVRTVGNRGRRGVGSEMRSAQVAAAGAVAIGNGLQDAARTMGVIVMVFLVAGHGGTDGVPWQVVLASAVALSLGMYAGGWRIVRTLGRRILTPAPTALQGAVAQSATAIIQYLAAVLHLPVSSTHTVTAALVGTGLTGRRSALRWGVIGRILLVWLVTFPATAGLSALLCLLFQQL